jgi:adenylate cyclase
MVNSPQSRDGEPHQGPSVLHSRIKSSEHPTHEYLWFIFMAMGQAQPEAALVWADVTEFTLAMESSESAMASRTMAWVARCVQGWLPSLGGQLLNQVGDAVVLSLPQAEHALQAARLLQNDWADLAPPNTGHAHELRTALHWGAVIRGPQGYVAHSLNQLARMAQQAPAGQIWGSEAFWRHLPASHRHNALELGWMHFKHLTRPIRVYAMSNTRQVPAKRLTLEAPLHPRLLVHGGPDDRAGDWAAAWVAHLSASIGLQVACLAQMHASVDGAALLHATGADYVLVQRRRVRERAGVELLATPHGLPIESWDGEAFDPQGPEVPTRITELAHAFREHGLALARSQPVSAMSPGLLRSTALGLMHVGHLGDFERADRWLQAWQSRYARSPEPHVWRVLWQVMRHTRGLGRSDAHAAMSHVQEALRVNPEHAHAWAARGFARAHLLGELQEGLRDLDRAQAHDPTLPWVGLYRSAVWSMIDEPQKALSDASAALGQTASDDLQGYALGLTGQAALFAGQPAKASQWLEQSWRQHRFHSPTLRMLVVAHQMMGHDSVARLFLRELMLLEPHLTARAYMGRVRAGHARRAEMAHWLIQAGLPLK